MRFTSYIPALGVLTIQLVLLSKPNRPHFKRSEALYITTSMNFYY